MSFANFPVRQGELIRLARGLATQAEFAKRLGVDRSCLSRYESEALGAPTTVINYCLRAIVGLKPENSSSATELQRALSHARQAVAELEAATQAERRKSAANTARTSRPRSSQGKPHA